jgi:F-type H+-transporting ATPase subunit alpha
MRGPIVTEHYYPVERIAPGWSIGQPVKEPLQTGLKLSTRWCRLAAVSAKLIIGDRQTGKRQCRRHDHQPKGKDVICIYVAIGQKGFDGGPGSQDAQDFGAMDYTIVIKATLRIRGDAVPRALFQARRRVSTSATAGRHALTDLRRLSKQAARIARFSLLLATLHRAARLIRRRVFICTRACWNGRKTFDLKAAVH